MPGEYLRGATGNPFCEHIGVKCGESSPLSPHLSHRLPVGGGGLKLAPVLTGTSGYLVPVSDNYCSISALRGGGTDGSRRGSERGRSGLRSALISQGLGWEGGEPVSSTG